MHRGRPVGEPLDHCPAGWIRQSRKRCTKFIHNHMVVDYWAMSTASRIISMDDHWRLGNVTLPLFQKMMPTLSHRAALVGLGLCTLERVRAVATWFRRECNHETLGRSGCNQLAMPGPLTSAMPESDQGHGDRRVSAEALGFRDFSSLCSVKENRRQSKNSAYVQRMELVLAGEVVELGVVRIVELEPGLGRFQRGCRASRGCGLLRRSRGTR